MTSVSARLADAWERGKSLDGQSLAHYAGLASARRLEAYLATLSEHDAQALIYDWPTWARPKQLPPPEPWSIWSVIAGRAWGKNRTGAEWVRSIHHTGNGAIIGATIGEARRYMVKGDSGILECSPPWDKPIFLETKGELVWPDGTVATLSSGEDGELRGANLAWAWCDEFAIWRCGAALWQNLLLALRSVVRPKILLTTTPRVVPWLEDVLLDPKVQITVGTSSENAPNLPPGWTDERAGQLSERQAAQELLAQWISTAEGGLISLAAAQSAVYTGAPPPCSRVIVSVDPSVSCGPHADETGILVVGASGGAMHVLDDHSGRYEAEEWAAKACALAAAHRCPVLIERNQGGDLLAMALRSVDPHVRVVETTATIPKAKRLGPLAVQVARGQVRLLPGPIPSELANWSPGAKSPGRGDALAQASVYLLPSSGESTTLFGRRSRKRAA